MDTLADSLRLADEEFAAGLARPADQVFGELGLDDALMEAVVEHTCHRCHYDVDEDGYCSMCGATFGS